MKNPSQNCAIAYLNQYISTGTHTNSTRIAQICQTILLLSYDAAFAKRHPSFMIPEYRKIN